MDVHRLASLYHWSEPEILRLTRRRRREYLSLIDGDDDADLLASLRTMSS